MTRNALAFAWCLAAGLGPGLAAAGERTPPSHHRQHIRATGKKKSHRHVSYGTASWYGPRFEGHRTSSGEIFHSRDLSAASPTLPLGSLVKVTNLANRHSVHVRINDCGPTIEGRKLDLSERAAEALGLKKRGIGLVMIDVIERPTDTRQCDIAQAPASNRPLENVKATDGQDKEQAVNHSPAAWSENVAAVTE